MSASHPARAACIHVNRTNGAHWRRKTIKRTIEDGEAAERAVKADWRMRWGKEARERCWVAKSGGEEERKEDKEEGNNK